jgi:tetratricopeptide (TPR) repeat protein
MDDDSDRLTQGSTAAEPRPAARFATRGARSSIRQFTDRKHAVATFKSLYEARSQRESLVLNYCGVGGIGKSRLLRQLQTLVEYEGLGVSVRLDLQQPALRRHDAALYNLRHQLHHKYKLAFPRFDIAYAVYWQRANPHTPLTKSGLPLVEEGGIVAAIIDAAGSTPVFGAAVGLLKGVDRVRRGAQHWRHLKLDENLRDLDTRDTAEVLDSLTYFLAADLKATLAQKSMSAFIMVDAHEALWDDVVTVGGLFDRDAWLRDLAAQLPGEMVVICSRDPLRWHEVDAYWSSERLIVYRLPDFSMLDSGAFLRSAGLSDRHLIAAIAKASQGLPFYLDLALDMCKALELVRPPVPNDFTREPEEILRRFLAHVPRSDEELTKLLSVPRYWDRKLGNHLIRQFNVGFPLSRWPEFERYSFIFAKEKGRLQFHQLMRLSVLEYMDETLKRDIHTAVHDYYRRQLKADDTFDHYKRFEWFREAAYHSVECGTIDLDWLGETANDMLERGLWPHVPDIVDEVRRNVLGASCDSPPLATLLAYIEGRTHRWAGRLDQARQTLADLDPSLIPGFEGRIRLELAHVSRESGATSNAAAMYAALRDDDYRDARGVRAVAVAWVGDIHLVQGRFRQAMTALTLASDLGTDAGVPQAVAQARRLMGHVERFLEYPHEALDHYAAARLAFEDLGYLGAIAEVNTNVAEALVALDPKGAIAAADQAAEEHRQLGHDLEVGKCLTARAQAELIEMQGREALKTIDHALAVLRRVGYRSGIGRALLTRAFALAQLGNRNLSLSDARSSAEELVATDTYPTLIVLGGHLFGTLQEEDARIEELSRLAWGRIELRHPDDPLDDRLRHLADRLIGQA